MEDFVSMFFGVRPNQGQRRSTSGGQGQGQGQQQNMPAPAMALLMQFMPILLLAVLSLWSGSMSFGEKETPFSFGRNAMYRYQMETPTGITYYVHPDTHSTLRSDIRGRRAMEQRVEEGWRRRLQTDCQFQMRQQKEMKNAARALNDENKKRRADEYSLSSCDELRERYGGR